MSYKQRSPLPIIQGGTNSSSFPFDHGVIVFEAGQQISINPGTAGQVLTSNGVALPPTFQSASGGFSWVNQTSSSVTMAIATGYIMNNGASLVTATLPTTAALGSEIRIVGKDSGLWTVAQNSGQSIVFAGVTTTVGASGSLSSVSASDCIHLVCTTADTVFTVVSSMGNITYV